MEKNHFCGLTCGWRFLYWHESFPGCPATDTSKRALIHRRIHGPDADLSGGLMGRGTHEILVTHWSTTTWSNSFLSTSNQLVSTTSFTQKHNYVLRDYDLLKGRRNQVSCAPPPNPIPNLLRIWYHSYVSLLNCAANSLKSATSKDIVLCVSDETGGGGVVFSKFPLKVH